MTGHEFSHRPSNNAHMPTDPAVQQSTQRKTSMNEDSTTGPAGSSKGKVMEPMAPMKADNGGARDMLDNPRDICYSKRSRRAVTPSAVKGKGLQHHKVANQGFRPQGRHSALRGYRSRLTPLDQTQNSEPNDEVPQAPLSSVSLAPASTRSPENGNSGSTRVCSYCQCVILEYPLHQCRAITQTPSKPLVGFCPPMPSDLVSNLPPPPEDSSARVGDLTSQLRSLREDSHLSSVTKRPRKMSPPGRAIANYGGGRELPWDPIDIGSPSDRTFKSPYSYPTALSNLQNQESTRQEKIPTDGSFRALPGLDRVSYEEYSRGPRPNPAAPLDQKFIAQGNGSFELSAFGLNETESNQQLQSSQPVASQSTTSFAAPIIVEPPNDSLEQVKPMRHPVSLPGIESFDHLAGIVPHEGSPIGGPLEHPHQHCKYTGSSRRSSCGSRTQTASWTQPQNYLPLCRMYRSPSPPDVEGGPIGARKETKSTIPMLSNFDGKHREGTGELDESAPPPTPLTPTNTLNTGGASLSYSPEAIVSEAAKLLEDIAVDGTVRPSMPSPELANGGLATPPAPEDEPHDSGTEDCIIVERKTRAKTGPCILKRQDGRAVKLVCPDCQKEDFSTSPGFIGHCRLKHQRVFKTGQEAAKKAGQLVRLTKDPKRMGRARNKEVVRSRRTRRAHKKW